MRNVNSKDNLQHGINQNRKGSTQYADDYDQDGISPKSIYPPPRLASTISSREYAFDADSDTVSETNLQLQGAGSSSSSQLKLPLKSSRPDNQSSSSKVLFNLNDLTSSNPGKNQNGEQTGTDRDQNDESFNEEVEEEPLLSSHKFNTNTNNDGDYEGANNLKPYPSPTDYLHLLDSGSGMIAGIANMSNSILGAGIIGIPYALRKAGFVTGTGMIIILGFITDWSIRLLALNSKMTGERTYIGILERCFGYSGKVAISFFQFIFAFGGMCAFGVIIGDSIPPVLGALFPFIRDSNWFSFLFSRSFVIAFFTISVSYPLSLHRDISKLSKASGLALISMVVIVLSVAIGGPLVDPKLKGSPSSRWTFIQPGFFEAVGVISFAFVCHHNSLLIYDSLKKPTLDRFGNLTHVSTTISVVASLAISFSGFLTFSDRTQANVLNNFPKDDFMINIARLCFGLNMFTTLPLECFVCRETIETCFYKESRLDKTRHIFYTTAIVGSVLIISLSTCDLGIVLELTGGFAAPALAFIFPAACQLKLTTRSINPCSSNSVTSSPSLNLNENENDGYGCDDDNDLNLNVLNKKKLSIFDTKNLPSLFTVGFGIVVMTISTTGSLYKAFDSSRAPKVCH